MERGAIPSEDRDSPFVRYRVLCGKILTVCRSDQCLSGLFCSSHRLVNKVTARSRQKCGALLYKVPKNQVGQPGSPMASIVPSSSYGPGLSDKPSPRSVLTVRGYL